jgi:hypothetical protein
MRITHTLKRVWTAPVHRWVVLFTSVDKNLHLDCHEITGILLKVAPNIIPLAHTLPKAGGFTGQFITWLSRSSSRLSLEVKI